MQIVFSTAYNYSAEDYFTVQFGLLSDVSNKKKKIGFLGNEVMYV